MGVRFPAEAPPTTTLLNWRSMSFPRSASRTPPPSNISPAKPAYTTFFHTIS